MIMPPRLPRRYLPEDEPADGAALMFAGVALAICGILLILTGCPAFTLSTVTTSANMGRAFEDPFSRGKTNWGASVTGQFTRDRRPE